MIANWWKKTNSEWKKVTDGSMTNLWRLPYKERMHFWGQTKMVIIAFSLWWKSNNFHAFCVQESNDELWRYDMPMITVGSSLVCLVLRELMSYEIPVS